MLVKYRVVLDPTQILRYILLDQMLRFINFSRKKTIYVLRS